jgi:hypothetical protein
LDSRSAIRKTFRRFILGLLALSCLNCAPGEFAALEQNSDTNGPVAVPEGAKFALGTLPESTSDLGKTIDLTANITASNTFSGTVSLTAEHEELDAIDLRSAIQVTVTPASLSLAPDETKQISIQVKIGTLAPSFVGEHFHVVGTEVVSTGEPAQAVTMGRLNVNAVFETLIYGGPAPENWSGTRTTEFISHTGGLKVRFINLDSQAHRVHSSGAIPHQANDMAPMGGVYEVVVPAGAQTSASSYCHSHEGSGSARSYLFNRL